MMLKRDTLLLLLAVLECAPASSQPAQPVDITPVNGQSYYLLNQLSALQAGLADGRVTPQQRSFTDLGQRWTFTTLSGGLWQVTNSRSRLCLDSAVETGTVCPATSRRCRPSPPRPIRAESAVHLPATFYVTQNPCQVVNAQEWVLNATTNGYYTISNNSTGLLIDGTEGSRLTQTALSNTATQSQQWLLRPTFFRGVDNALLEKQEADRAASGLPWWSDAGQPQDVLQILKNHGVNTVRLRPSSVPPYADVSQSGCTGNACYGETEAQDLDLARRARNLGMSIVLSLLFDGGSSSGVPPAWSADLQVTDLQPVLYAYVKSEILSYRQAGVMPDMVAIGNEVDTGFLGPLGSPTGADFGGFAALQIQGMQAVRDAAADTSIGPAIPAPLTCIHITPAWDLTQFFTLANQNNIPYDAICQSYYPIFHGPLTEAQAAASNPNSKPVEQDVLMNAADKIGKPIFIIETGEHYENGFDTNDPWYAPPTQALQRQFLLDVQAVQDGLPNNLGMGFEYWDAAGVNLPKASGGLFNGDNIQDAIYIWNGLTLFDTAGASGSATLLPAIDALGGKLDATLSYKLINLSSGQILSITGSSLHSAPDDGNPSASQQWRISSNNDGYFQIASLSNTANVLDDSGASVSAGNPVVLSPSGSGQEFEWDIVSAANGYFQLLNRVSGLVLDLDAGTGLAVQEPQSSASQTQQWQIVPVP